VFEKDLRIERVTGEILTTTGYFSVLISVLVSIALSQNDHSLSTAAAVLWVTVAFATVLSVGRSWYREREGDALGGMLLSPLPRSAIFVGKAWAVAIFLLAVEMLTLLVLSILFSFDAWRFAGGLLGIAAAATPGLAASATLFGAMTARTRARDLVLATVLFPLFAPTLLAAVAATRELLEGAALADLRDYLLLMGAFDVVFGLGGMALFDTLLDS